MNIQYNVMNLNTTEDKSKFFELALKNKLYVISENPHYKSRLLNLYTGARESKDLLVIMAYNKESPIGLVVCENESILHPLNKVKEKRFGGFKILKTSDCNILRCGFLSFFVKDEYRKNKIAMELMKRVESERVKQVCSILNEKTYMAFEAKEKAYEILKKYSKYAYPLNIGNNSYNMPLEINDLYQFMYELDEQEKISNRCGYSDKEIYIPEIKISKTQYKRKNN